MENILENVVSEEDLVVKVNCKSMIRLYIGAALYFLLMIPTMIVALDLIYNIFGVILWVVTGIVLFYAGTLLVHLYFLILYKLQEVNET